jgi:hypothetical protein
VPFQSNPPLSSFSAASEVVPCYKAQRVDLFITRLSKIDIHLTEFDICLREGKKVDTNR